MNYTEFFQLATNRPDGLPHPYQSRLAEASAWPEILNIPTGLGKTAAVILSWLYRRRMGQAEIRNQTPRRLVYCLPMRTLVEQTQDSARAWIANLKLDTGENPVSVHVLMGGMDAEDWDSHPERDAILIGTQDMLLSRALNRGYGMSRYRWPIHYGLLNNDSQWVLDETQLMGVGMTTSAQLAGLRAKLATYGPSHTLWMSATLDPQALETIDHPRPETGWNTESLQTDDLANEFVQRLISAEKPCSQAETLLNAENAKKDYASQLAEEVLQSHQAGTLTLVVLNRVNRTQDLWQAIQKALKKEEQPPEIHLIHSRFRPCERTALQSQALNESTIPPQGRIVIATQAIEAGVDISATTLFTELALWSSLVQRFGRCNRRGICGLEGHPSARVRWIDIDTQDEKKARNLALPYEIEDLNRARTALQALQNVGPQALAEVRVHEPQPVVHVIRRKDLLELFDTTPDLSGNDLDISRYIREGDNNDVQVYWRDWNQKEQSLKGKPPVPAGGTETAPFSAPRREELCAVSVGDFRSFVEKLGKNEKTKRLAWRWNPLDHAWEETSYRAIRPGMTILLHVSAGGYDPATGWTGEGKHGPVPEFSVEETLQEQGSLESMEDDDVGQQPIELSRHLQDVAEQVESLRETLPLANETLPWEEIHRAAWWHDVGKAHPAFQGALKHLSEDLESSSLWAKSGGQGRLIYQMPDQSRRPGFRHELASALAWLAQHRDTANGDLIAYLIAAHHGKVRLSIRGMPNEKRPTEPTQRFARGLWDGDELPEVEIGNGEVSRACPIDLRLMELGEDEDGNPSWLARTLALREQYGPFRLAYLETLLRVCDWRGSCLEAEA